MKLKDYIKIYIIIITSIVLVSASCIGFINHLGSELRHEVLVYKAESDTINLVQQWLIVDLNVDQVLQDKQNTEVNRRLEDHLSVLNALTTRVINNQIQIDDNSIEGLTERIKELENDVKRLYERVE